MTYAVVFPGQGSQSIGMLMELAETRAQIKETFQEASDALGYDLWQLVQNGPEEELNKTHITQPAMLAGGVAVWRVWQSLVKTQPAVMAGHSLGEYSALVATGSLSLSDAVTLVADRGRFMQDAVPAGEGAMAAILGLDDDKVGEVCAEAAKNIAGEVVAAVNYNSPGQVVIAGNTAAVNCAVMLAKEAGAKRALSLPVSVPSHCSLMMPAAERLAGRLSDITIQSPVIPVINNVDVQAESAADAIRDALKRQLFSPVRWVDTVQAFAAQGIQQVVECGPGKVLAGLNKRINREMTGLTTSDIAGLGKAVQAIGEGE
ncbi:MAG: ACP S-malonyltransferase [Gammaproteobacteria bacterium]|nr:ACP S-malonyltransferase [Gammaproteobacteria bacterium]